MMCTGFTKLIQQIAEAMAKYSLKLCKLCNVLCYTALAYCIHYFVFYGTYIRRACSMRNIEWLNVAISGELLSSVSPRLLAVAPSSFQIYRHRRAAATLDEQSSTRAQCAATGDPMTQRRGDRGGGRGRSRASLIARGSSSPNT
jgi:hypothetical protein